MSDTRNPEDLTPDNLPVGAVDASGQPIDLAGVLPAEQPPMDDAAGGPDVDVDDTSTDDLSVQGGE